MIGDLLEHGDEDKDPRKKTRIPTIAVQGERGGLHYFVPRLGEEYRGEARIVG